MLKFINKHILYIVLSALAVTFQVQAQAQEKTSPAEVTDKRKNQFPFNGKIHSVDKTAMTILLEGRERKRTIHVTAQTRITKDGKVAKIDDAVAGEEVGGLVSRLPDGKEEAISLRLGPKPGSEPRTPKESEGAPASPQVK